MPRNGPLAALVLAGSLVAACAISWWFQTEGTINHDEGWVLHAGLRLLDGELPYRDFAFYQGPVLAAVYAIAQGILGAGVEAGRSASGALGLAAIALAAHLVWQLRGAFAAAVVPALVATCPLAMWGLSTTRSEPANAFFLALAAWGLLSPGDRAWRRGLGFAAVVLAAGTRVASLPVALVVGLWLVLSARSQGERGSASALLGPGLAVAAGLVALGVAAGLDLVFFDLVTAQTTRHAQLEAASALGPLAWITSRFQALSALHGHFGVIPAFGFTGALAALVFHFDALRSGWRKAPPLAGLALFALLAYAPNLAPRDVYPLYFAAVAPLFAAVFALGVAELWDAAPAAGRRALALSVCMALLLQIGTFIARRPLHLRSEPTDLAELQTVADEIDRVLAPGSQLATLDVYLAVEMDRRVPRGFDMSLFAFFPRMEDEERADELGLLTPRSFARALRSPEVGAVVLSDRSLGVLVARSIHGLRPPPSPPLGEAELHELLPPLRRFRLARTWTEFGQFEDPLYLFVPTSRGRASTSR